MGRRPQLNVADLILLVGERKALHLCRLYGGSTIPTPEKYLREKRDRAIARDWLYGGATIDELSVRYGMPKQAIRAKLTVIGKVIKQAEKTPHGNSKFPE